jgi:hypothetical protein
LSAQSAGDQHRFAGDIGCDLGHHAVGVVLAGGVVDDDRRAFIRQMLGDGGANPLDAPVTIATLSLSLPMCWFLMSGCARPSRSG